MRPVYACICLIGAVFVGMLIGACTIALEFSRQAPESPAVSFNDFVGALLACIAIIITLFGVFLAVLAFYGFSAIQERVHTSASAAATETVEKSFEQGGQLYVLTELTVKKAMFRGTRWEDPEDPDPEHG